MVALAALVVLCVAASAYAARHVTAHSAQAIQYFRYGSQTTGSLNGMFSNLVPTAQFEQTPAGAMAGTLTHTDFGRPPNIPYRKLTMSIGNCQYTANTDGVPAAAQTAGQVQCDLKVTDVVHPNPSTCHIGSTGVLIIFAPQTLYDPIKHQTIYENGVNVTVTDCALNDEWDNGHVGNQVTLNVSATPGATADAPWSVHSDFDVYVPPLAGGNGPADISISYSVPQRFGAIERDGLARYMTQPSEFNPPDWPIELSTSPCAQHTTYEWSVGNRRFTEHSCKLHTTVPQQGTYAVSVEIPGKHGQPAAEGTRDIVVRDFLIVGIGDSMGSGEGVPDVEIDRSHSSAVWENRQCHRSEYSWQADLAHNISVTNSWTVSFLHLACSGASVPVGLLGGYEGIEPNPQQIDEVRRITAGRTIDALLMSIGVNDLHFGPLITFCIFNSDCRNRTVRWDGTNNKFVNDPNGTVMTQLIANFTADLTVHYAQLNQALQGLVEPNRVYLIQYPDSTRNGDGNSFCDSLAALPWIGQFARIRAADTAWLADGFAAGLNAAGAAAAQAYGWNYISGAADEFRTHGYCAGKKSWIVTTHDSRAHQGDLAGTLHPNRVGHVKLMLLARKMVVHDLLPGDVPRPPD